MCMNFEHMFLTMMILAPSNPEGLIDVYLELLIEELQNLWHVAVPTHNNATIQAFTMHRLVHMDCEQPTHLWDTICTVCMDDTWIFHFQNGRNACYFDCHR
ncbi:UNVERIFIED_CONTAM: hypothetical protein Sradi_2514300 [Sesamum radiatum]|uniref:Secreted protein n=1 Tax=Sesamum radiatum TaxID=300843 RepID=A0AAW2SK81_SESRA